MTVGNLVDVPDARLWLPNYQHVLAPTSKGQAFMRQTIRKSRFYEFRPELWLSAPGIILEQMAVAYHDEDKIFCKYEYKGKIQTNLFSIETLIPITEAEVLKRKLTNG